jgi:hypothetical protein
LQTFKRKEKAYTETYIKNANPTSIGVQTLSVETMVNEVTARTLYVPFLMMHYRYCDKQYLFLVNAIDGTYQGERPGYGLGKLGSNVLVVFCFFF